MLVVDGTLNLCSLLITYVLDYAYLDVFVSGEKNRIVPEVFLNTLGLFMSKINNIDKPKVFRKTVRW